MDAKRLEVVPQLAVKVSGSIGFYDILFEL